MEELMEEVKEEIKREESLLSEGREWNIGISPKFALINKLITRDLNNYGRATYGPSFFLYTKEHINMFLSNPYKYEKKLRRAIAYIYGASPHFRRLIQYFTSLTDLAYIVSPYKVTDPKTINKKSVNRNYRKVLNTLSSMSIKTQFPKIITVCLRDDVFYGTMWVTPDSITIQQLPSDYCKISSIEGNVLNVAFDFSYFVTREDMLAYYPEEFRRKYEQVYQKNKLLQRWIELDAPTSFAIKYNSDILEYAIPPFAGLLRDIYDIDDYKLLKKAREEIENYAMLAMKLPMDDEGNWLLDYKKAEEFWRNLDAVMPPEVGSILSPMDIDKISFERSHDGDTDTVVEAEDNLFSAAGVSSLLFNNTRASANALLLSIKVDQELTFSIVKSIEDMLNRYIQYQNYGKNFKVTFLDVSTFNRKEAGDAYLKAASYGLPTISMYAASQGLSQAELDSMSFLETDVLELQKIFKPLISSTQLSAEEVNVNNEAVNNGSNPETGGRPQMEGTDLTDSGEESREDSSDWG